MRPLLTALLLTASAPATDAQTPGGQVLLRPFSSRALALGEAYAAASDDVLALLYNPGAPLAVRQAAALFQPGPADEKFGVVGVGWPNAFGHAAVLLAYHDAGPIDLDNGTDVERTVTAAADYLLGLSGGFKLGRGVSLGASAKILRSRLVDEFAATALLADAGAQYRPSANLALGLAAQNLGAYVGKSAFDPGAPPRVFRAGAAYRLRSLSQTLTPAAELVSTGAAPKPEFGLEYAFGPLAALRAGYRPRRDVSKLTAGFGLSIDGVGFDYAFSPDARPAPAHLFTMTMRF